jgi:hypothetical protein
MIKMDIHDKLKKNHTKSEKKYIRKIKILKNNKNKNKNFTKIKNK